MEPYLEYEVRGARPRRNIRPPVRWADYEVDNPSYISPRYRDCVETDHQD